MVSKSGKDFYAFTLEQKIRQKYYVNDQSVPCPAPQGTALLRDTQAISSLPRA